MGDIPRDDGTLREFVRYQGRSKEWASYGNTLSNFSPSDTSVTKVRERARQGAGLCGYFVGQEPVTGSFRAMPRNGPEEEGMTQACARPLVPKSIKDILRAE